MSTIFDPLMGTEQVQLSLGHPTQGFAYKTLSVAILGLACASFTAPTSAQPEPGNAGAGMTSEAWHPTIAPYVDEAATWTMQRMTACRDWATDGINKATPYIAGGVVGVGRVLLMRKLYGAVQTQAVRHPYVATAVIGTAIAAQASERGVAFTEEIMRGVSSVSDDIERRLGDFTSNPEDFRLGSSYGYTGTNLLALSYDLVGALGVTQKLFNGDLGQAAPVPVARAAQARAFVDTSLREAFGGDAGVREDVRKALNTISRGKWYGDLKLKSVNAFVQSTIKTLPQLTKAELNEFLGAIQKKVIGGDRVEQVVAALKSAYDAGQPETYLGAAKRLVEDYYEDVAFVAGSPTVRDAVRSISSAALPAALLWHEQMNWQVPDTISDDSGANEIAITTRFSTKDLITSWVTPLDESPRPDEVLHSGPSVDVDASNFTVADGKSSAVALYQGVQLIEESAIATPPDLAANQSKAVAVAPPQRKEAANTQPSPAPQGVIDIDHYRASDKYQRMIEEARKNEIIRDLIEQPGTQISFAPANITAGANVQSIPKTLDGQTPLIGADQKPLVVPTNEAEEEILPPAIVVERVANVAILVPAKATPVGDASVESADSTTQVPTSALNASWTTPRNVSTRQDQLLLSDAPIVGNASNLSAAHDSLPVVAVYHGVSPIHEGVTPIASDLSANQSKAAAAEPSQRHVAEKAPQSPAPSAVIDIHQYRASDKYQRMIDEARNNEIIRELIEQPGKQPILVSADLTGIANVQSIPKTLDGQTPAVGADQQPFVLQSYEAKEEMSPPAIVVVRAANVTSQVPVEATPEGVTSVESVSITTQHLTHGLLTNSTAPEASPVADIRVAKAEITWPNDPSVTTPIAPDQTFKTTLGEASLNAEHIAPNDADAQSDTQDGQASRFDDNPVRSEKAASPVADDVVSVPADLKEQPVEAAADESATETVEQPLQEQPIQALNEILAEQDLSQLSKLANLIRPEAGSYTSNAWAANTMFQMNLNDRLGSYHPDVAGTRQGNAWVRYSGSHSHLRDSVGQVLTNGDKNAVMMGVDMLRQANHGREQVTAGIMGGYGHFSGKSRAKHFNHSSLGKVDGFGVGLYGTYQRDSGANRGFYADGWMLWNQFQNRAKGQDLPAQQYDAKGITAAVEVGSNITLAERGNVTYRFEPRTQFVYQNVRSRDLDQADGTHVEFGNGARLQTTVGARFAAQIATGLTTVVTPHVEVNWLHTTKGYSVKLDDVSSTMNSGRNTAQLKLGVQGELNRHLSLNIELFHNQGTDRYHETGGNLSTQYRF